jgi:hypothetical protein
MWSVNIEVSISGEYQALGVNTGWLSEYQRSLRTGTGVTAISDDRYKCTMQVIVISLGPFCSARENVGCTWKCRRTDKEFTNIV